MHVCVLIFQMDPSQEPVLRLRSGTRAGQAQRRRPMGLSCSGWTIRRTLAPLPHSLCTRLMHISLSNFS